MRHCDTSHEWQNKICDRIDDCLAGPFAAALIYIVGDEFEQTRQGHIEAEEAVETLRKEFIARLGVLERDVLLMYAKDGLRIAETEYRQPKERKK